MLAQLQPDLVVDASGPFQAYGDEPYQLVKDCIAAGCNYIDLADGADFVSGISVLNDEATKVGCFVLSGMSSFPVLTAAVVRKLAVGLDSVEETTAGIAPSPFAGVGLNVIRAIASYSGKPVKLLRDGKLGTGTGFFDSRKMVVNVPGFIPLRPIRFALTDVPDLKILPTEWPALKTMWMGAGPTPAVLHRLLWLAAGLVKLRILPSLVPLAPVMNWVINTVRWGEHRGGMIVEVKGRLAEEIRKVSWHLLAEGEGGPFIPSMAAEAIVRMCLNGTPPAAGARSGHRDLELEDYAPLLSAHGIQYGFREERPATIYEQALGPAFQKIAPPLQKFHRNTTAFSMRGKADVERASSTLARIVSAFFGFPKAGKNIDLKVQIDFDGRHETWARVFAGKRFKSKQSAGSGRYEGLIVESFGPFNFGMAVTEMNGRLGLILRDWDILGLPMPRILLPSIAASEHGADDRFNFDVELKHPLLGLLVRYKGWLE